METGQLTFGSLFAGIGGIDLGLERAGMKCVWQVEIDSYCQKVLVKHWPEVRRWFDVKTFPPKPEEEWRCDLIAGGFPCQPVSIAGKRKAQEDERWLWPEFIRTIRVLRPLYVLVENTPGLLDRGFSDVLGDLAECGYDSEWDCLPAAAFGAVHIRNRIFLLAYPNGLRGLQPEGCKQDKRRRLAYSGQQSHVHNTYSRRCRTQKETVFAGRRGIELSDLWSREPGLGRVAHGVPNRLDRCRGLGNACVPQVIEWIGRRIIE